MTRILLPTLACLLAVPATAQVNYEILFDSIARVVSSPDASGDVVIASTYNGYPVTSVADHAFYNCTNLTSVTIPDSVAYIGGYTFHNCASLTSVVIPRSITSIGPGVFSDCTGLTNITVAVDNPAYGSIDGVLFNKAQTDLIQFPGGRGGRYVIPNSVTSIGEWAFSGCTRLMSVTIPNSVTSLSRWAFLRCTSLTNLTIGNGVTSIGNAAVSQCTSLTSVTIPNSVTNIEEGAFSGCSNLTSVTIGNGVTSIGSGAFSSCKSLSSVTIPSSVINVGVGAFSSCSSLSNLIVDAANPVYSSLNGVLFNKAQTTLLQFPGGRGGDYVIPNGVTTIGEAAFVCTSLTNLTIGNSVTHIGDRAFYECTSLTSVTLGNSVTSIGERAFNLCTNLTSVTIPESVTEIGEAAFGSCASLTKLTIGNGVTSIGHSVFVACRSLTSVTIPDSVTNIWTSAFGSCTSLTDFSVDAANSVYSSLKGVLFNKGQTTLILFPPGRDGGYVVPDSATSIGNDAFRGCTSLASVTISNGVTSIGHYAFELCTSLASVTIPDSATNIGYHAFGLCTSLTNITVGTDNPAYSSIDGVLFNKAQTILIQFPAGRGGGYVIPNGVTTIDSGAFAFSRSLASVTFPDSVTVLHIYYGRIYSGGFRPSSPFFGCDSLTSLTFLGDTPYVGYPFHSVGRTVYYYYGTTGWEPTFLGFPTVMRGAPPPQISPAGAGAQPGGFGFTLGGVTNQTIVIEASTNLINWQPVWTNTLSGTSASFTDPQWLDYPNRFYRARSN